MFRRFKKWLTTWAEEVQRREIARLRQDNMRLKEEGERETGKPVQLTPEEWRLLAEKAEGIDPDTLKQISVFDLEDLTPAEPQTDSAETR
jgi:hypothetical protein